MKNFSKIFNRQNSDRKVDEILKIIDDTTEETKQFFKVNRIYLLSKFKLFSVPFFLSVIFLQAIYIPKPQDIHFVNVFDKKTKQISKLFIDEDKEKTKSIPVFIPDKLILSILKLPSEMGDFDFCISQKSFAINPEEQEISAKNKLFVYTGSVLEESDYINKNSIVIDQETKVCSEDYGIGKNIYFTSFEFDNKETLERVQEWGLDDIDHKYLSGIFRIKFYLKPKYESVILIFPIVITYLWWATLLFYYKIKEQILNHTK